MDRFATEKVGDVDLADVAGAVRVRETIGQCRDGADLDREAIADAQRCADTRARCRRHGEDYEVDGKRLDVSLD